MIGQTVQPFKLKGTDEKVTARTGLVLYREFMKAIGVDYLIERYLPKPYSGRGFEPIRYIKPLSMMLYGGGEAMEDVREVREDDSLREVVGLEEVPSCSTIGDWLRRMRERGGIVGMERVNDGIVRRVLRRGDRRGAKRQWPGGRSGARESGSAAPGDRGDFGVLGKTGRDSASVRDGMAGV